MILDASCVAHRAQEDTRKAESLRQTLNMPPCVESVRSLLRHRPDYVLPACYLLTTVGAFSKRNAVGKRVLLASLLLLVCASLSGCVTADLWEKQAFDGFKRPANPPNLQVYKTENDWLIQYDEANEKNARIRRRAFYLNENHTAINAHKRPRFVERPETASFPVANALISKNADQFTLYEGGATVGTFEFPVYPDPSGRVKQVLLTPGALLIDATIAAAAVAVVAGYAWLQAGAPTGCWD